MRSARVKRKVIGGYWGYWVIIGEILGRYPGPDILCKDRGVLLCNM